MLSHRPSPRLAPVGGAWSGDVVCRVLGSIEVGDGDVGVQLGPPKQRAVFAILLLHPGEIVPADRLIELVWGEQPPRTAAHSIQLYVSDLRKALEAIDGGPVIETRAPGYVLQVEIERIDARRFEALVLEGARALEGGDPTAAVAAFSEAIALWRGPPLSEFAYEAFAQPEIRRLEGLHLRAIEDLGAAELELGRPQEALAALERAIEQDPLRERARELQMLALYRTGRHAEALRVYQRYAGLLAEELGLDPTPSLRRLQERILLHDPELAAPAEAAALARLRNPYKGLRAFDEEDAEDFFGREELVERLVASLADGARLVTVVGPSGCGKSSVVNAGLIPAIRGGAVNGSEGWAIARMMPGAHPLEALRVALSSAGADGASDDPVAALVKAAERGCASRDLLLVIDQFEEAFSAAEDPERARFLDGLAAAAGNRDGRVWLVLTLRGDFYDRPLLHPAFARVFVASVVNVLPMTPDQAESAILGPARRVGAEVEPSLLAALVVEAIEQPASLPFLQFALTELFDRRTETRLTIGAFRELGGLHGVVSRRAEEAYGHLDEVGRGIALQVFLRLVRLETGARHSRRRARLSELTALDADPASLSEVLAAFADHRLLSLDRDPATGDATVEVAHEALLWEWDRLARWIEGHRADVRRRASLSAAAEEWRASGRLVDYLLVGSRLTEYRGWAEGTELRLAAPEREFLEESVRHHEEERTEEAARAKAQDLLERRARRRLRGLVASVALLVAAGTFALLSSLAGRPADVALLFAGYGDGGYRDTIAAGFDSAARELDLSAERAVLTYRRPDEYGTELERLSDEGVDLIVASETALNQARFEAIAADHPETHYIALEILTGRLQNVAYVNFEDQEGSFLAGAAAALKSRTGIVGFIGGAELPVIWRFEAGFEAGALAVRPDIEVRIVYLRGEAGSGFDDPAQAQRVATRLYRNGADVIFHAAGNSGLGLFQAAYQVSGEVGEHLWAIGVDADQYREIRYAVGEDLAAAWRDHILTSMLKRFDTAVYTIMAEHARGDWMGGGRWFGLAEEGVGLAASGGFIDDIRPELDRLSSRIVSGEIEVPTIPARMRGTDEPRSPER
jgi:basic membrane lipoprotein Med (substrate-binding protein (PBP1-ABC) superfamily)/DNA-binding SARP family transcriptional activator